jgi:hypothetical protein
MTDTNNWPNVTRSIQIGISHSELIQQWFIQFQCEYKYWWIMQNNFSIGY